MIENTLEFVRSHPSEIVDIFTSDMDSMYAKMKQVMVSISVVRIIQVEIIDPVDFFFFAFAVFEFASPSGNP